MLPSLFVRPAIIELFKVQKLARYGEPVTKTWDILEPYERLIKIDLRKRKSELLNEFQNYIEHEIGIQEAAKQFWPKDLQLSYLLWEPENERQRKEAWIQLEVWKLRKQYKCYPEIAMILKLKKNTAKKSFYKAYERIYGKPYSNSTFKDIVRQQLDQQIKTEPNKDKKINLFEARLELDEKKQSEKIMDFDSDIKTNDTAAFETDPNVRFLFRDIEREYCRNCPDIECQKIFYNVCKGENPEAWNPCPKVIEFIEQ
jgi:antitoxin component YwqK of YwqJK toxin-antitoxin module